MTKHFKIRVTGKVQGVFFRASTKTEADKYNINGFVRNEDDGSVYIEAEGEMENLQAFTAWCKHGPRMAQVERCEVHEDVLKGFDNFRVSKS
jgi:acylphosphatase